VRKLAGDVPAAEDDPPEEWMYPVEVDERKRARPARACTEDRLEHDEGGGRADHRDCAAHGLVVAKEPAAAEAEAAIERQTREAAKEVELDDGDVDRAAEDDGVASQTACATDIRKRSPTGPMSAQHPQRPWEDADREGPRDSRSTVRRRPSGRR